MNIHEYQAKELLARSGVPVPAGYAALSVEEAAAAAAQGDRATAGMRRTDMAQGFRMGVIALLPLALWGCPPPDSLRVRSRLVERGVPVEQARCFAQAAERGLRGRQMRRLTENFVHVPHEPLGSVSLAQAAATVLRDVTPDIREAVAPLVERCG